MAQVSPVFPSAPQLQETNPLQSADALFAQFLASKEKGKLEEAYKLCLPLAKREEPAALTRLSMIVGEYGILHYGVAPPGSDKPDFSASREILLVALLAFLTRIDANGVRPDFPDDLAAFAASAINRRLYAAVEATFIKSDKDALLAKAASLSLTEQEGNYLSRMLRYNNGARRAFWGDPMSESDKAFTRNTLYLAAHFGKGEEFWEVMYNDWQNLLTAEGRWNPETEDAHIKWLIDHKSYGVQAIRVINKFKANEERVRQAIDLCHEIFKVDDLRAILKGDLLDQARIDAVAKELSERDFSREKLNVSWFAILPNNLAYFLLQKEEKNRREIEGLLRFAMALVKIYEGRRQVLNHFPLVKEKWKSWKEQCDQFFVASLPTATAQNRMAEFHIMTVSQNTTDVAVKNIKVEENLQLLAQVREMVEKARQVFEEGNLLVGEEYKKIALQMLATAHTNLTQIEALEASLKQVKEKQAATQ